MIRAWSELILCCFLVGTLSCRSHRQLEKWIIPDNYTGWIRVDYAVAGAPPLATEGPNHVLRVPSNGRLRTSSPYNPSVNNEYFTLMQQGLQRLELSKWDSAQSRNAIEGYAVQNVFGFFKLANGKLQDQGKCLFVGTQAAFRENDQDCRSWEYGQSEPPKFKRPNVLHKPNGESH